MNRAQREQNLQRLTQQLSKELDDRGAAAKPRPTAEADLLGESLSLSHAFSEPHFLSICDGGRILSGEAVALAHGKPLRRDAAEVLLGTARYVFFYVGPFRYPATSCGFLFHRSLETAYPIDGCATPFDSGALVRHVTLPAGSPSPQAFLEAHELPVPEHRQLLALCLDLCFVEPMDYVTFTDGIHHRPSPYGIRGGDFRQHTHEVRIPDEVAVRSSHLEAVFVAGRVARHKQAEELARWCLQEKVTFRAFPHGGESDFTALRRESITYLRSKLY